MLGCIILFNDLDTSAKLIQRVQQLQLKYLIFPNFQFIKSSYSDINLISPTLISAENITESLMTY